MRGNATDLGIALVVTFVAFASLISATGAATLVFEPGPTGQLPGGPAGSSVISIANNPLTRIGIDDIVVGLGVYPPTPVAKVPLRLLAPQPDGTVLDITSAAFGAAPPAFTHPRDIVFGDINLDGHADIFIAAHGYDQAPYPGETDGLLLSQPDGSFLNASGQLPTAPAFSHSAAIGVLTSNGNPDVYVGNIYGEGDVPPYILLGNGGTAMTVSNELPVGVSPLSSNTYTTSLFLDVDNDGYPDLILGSAVGNNGSQSLILFNDGTGNFSTRPVGYLPPGLFGDNTINLNIAVIDINGDGFPDLLISQTQNDPFYAGHAIQVLVNNRDGTFVDQTATYLPNAISSTGPWYQFIRVADLNGDGIPDFYIQGVIGTSTPGQSVVFAWVSNGIGRYVPVDSSVLGDINPSSVTFTELNSGELPSLVELYNDAAGQIHYATFFNVTPVTKTINYQGLWWASPAGVESGWGINFAHQGKTIFASWFSYDTTGKGWWLTMTAPEIVTGVYSGTLYATTGPAFNAVPFSPAQVKATPVGSGTLTFSDGNDGTFAYTVNGISQTKSITHQVFGPVPVCATATTALSAATNYTDLWWASPPGSESGWGINFTQQGNTIFATWFTYALGGTPMWLSVTAQNTAPGVFSGMLYQTAGPAFNAVPFNPADVALTNVGTATFTFSDGNDATFAYTVNGVSQTKAITRQVFQSPGTLCQ